MENKILVVDYSGHPFQIQLSKQLARLDNQVKHIYCGSFTSPKGNVTEKNIPNYEIEALHLKVKVDKTNFIRRRQADIEFGKLLRKEVQDYMPDIVILSNLPLDSLRILCPFLKRINIPYIYWLQDIYSIAMTSVLNKKIPFFGYLIGWYYSIVEKKALAYSNAIVSITNDFIPILDQWSIDVQKFVIPNWAPLDELPVKNKENEWSLKHNLADKDVILYSGTLGYKHNPDLLIKLGRALNEDQCLLIISEGAVAEYVKSQTKESKNILVLPFQDFDQMPNILATANVLIGILEKEAGVFSVPSKVLTYLTSARPVVLSVPTENLVSRLIRENDIGMSIEPEDDQVFVETCLKLLEDKERCLQMGLNGRGYAEKYFNIVNIAENFKKAVKKALV